MYEDCPPLSILAGLLDYLCPSSSYVPYSRENARKLCGELVERESKHKIRRGWKAASPCLSRPTRVQKHAVGVITEQLVKVGCSMLRRLLARANRLFCGGVEPLEKHI